MVPQVHPLTDEGLGNTTWIVDLGDRRALVVDPPRDLRAVRTAAERLRLRVAWVADTHLHADYLSGAVQLGSEGAQVLASKHGLRQFPHTALDDGDEVDIGGLTLRTVLTPGHTDEHLAYLLLDAAEPVGVFTGGSLIVGSAARTDLMGEDRTEELTAAQFASLQRLAALPPQTAVWPTHGAGSFCSAPGDAARSSSIGAELESNPLLTATTAEEFAARLLPTLGSYPRYFGRLAEVNRRGPAILDRDVALPQLSPRDLQRHLGSGGLVVDVRPVSDVAAGHIPGSIAIPLRAQFATWLGWIVDPDEPVVIVRNEDQSPDDIVWPALNIGIESIAGELAGGIAAWRESGGTLVATPVASPATAPAALLDVRQAREYAAGHVAGAAHLELGALSSYADDVPTGPLAVMCGHGERAMTAATLLERSGRRDVAVVAGGPREWAAAAGGALVQGS